MEEGLLDSHLSLDNDHRRIQSRADQDATHFQHKKHLREQSVRERRNFDGSSRY